MKNRSETFFTEDEKQSIEASIKEAESRTSGEIVTMVVEQSDGYRDTDVTTGILAAALLSIYPAELFFANSEFLIRKFIPSMSWFSQIPDETRFTAGLLLFISLTVILTFPLKMIFRKFPLLKKFIITAKRMDEEVKERALRGFHEHGLGNTKDSTGVLFLISIFEKKVQILADHGIYSKIKQETLDRYASSVGKGIASGKGGEALCTAIKEIGNELEKHFPRSHDDRNELRDSLVTEK